MFAMQKEMNEMMFKTAPYFMPPAILDGEDNAFSLWQENTHCLFSEKFNMPANGSRISILAMMA